ncbi:MAG: sugar phosphate isomerase/epimerase [Clostridia bacterium]|nr:sugar phosphate isomerase/epimerase [Clostridia bacterium]
MKYGLQLYSVRDVAEKDIELAMKETAAMGYSFVEFAGFQGKTAEEIKELLDKYNLGVSGTHTGVDQLSDENFDETVKAHKTIGCENIIIPGTDLSTKENVDKFIDRVNELIPRLEKEGLKLHYHNHSSEFLPNEDGVVAEYELFNRTNVGLEIDCYWAFNAGKDALQVLDEFKGRVSVIHLKDGVKGGKGLSLGQGDAKAAEVRKKAIEMGLTIVVESEGLDPTGLEEVKRCIDFLKEEDKK